MITIEPVPVATLHARRQAHFARLHQPPELYLELMVSGCRAYLLRESGAEAGHALVTSDGTLIELALTSAGCRVKQKVFAELCQTLGLRRALCFSFDSTLVSLCVAGGSLASPHGVLWREYIPRACTSLPVLRLAVERDIERILPYRENVFDTEEQVPIWVQNRWTYVLDEGDDLVGVGLCSPVWPETPQRDIGVMVHPAKRGLGHGQRIVASLAEKCLREGLVPTAGCAHDNLASQRTLLRAGFVSRDSLIEFRAGC